MLVEHEMELTETGNLQRVSALREVMDGLTCQVEKEIAAGSFTAKRRAQFFAAITALLDYHTSDKPPSSPLVL